MELEFLERFGKDIDKIKNKEVKNAFFDLIDEMKMLKSLSDLPNVKKLKGFKNFYRIRLGEYRIGIEYNNSKITFMRFLLRKDIYKYFP